VLTVFASPDVAVKTVERAAAVSVYGIIIQEPGIAASSSGLVENGFGYNAVRHLFCEFKI
jgi:hypothetical protein